MVKSILTLIKTIDVLFFYRMIEFQKFKKYINFFSMYLSSFQNSNFIRVRNSVFISVREEGKEVIPLGSEAERARSPHQSIEKSVHRTIRKREKNQHHIKTQLSNNKGNTLAKYTDLTITWSTRQDHYLNQFFVLVTEK